MTARKKLTPKQQVLKKWPNAIIAWDSYGTYIEVPRVDLGSGKTVAAAWADAARRLERK